MKRRFSNGFPVVPLLWKHGHRSYLVWQTDTYLYHFQTYGGRASSPNKSYHTPFRTPFHMPFLMSFREPFHTPFHTPFRMPFRTPFCTPFGLCGFTLTVIEGCRKVNSSIFRERTNGLVGIHLKHGTTFRSVRNDVDYRRQEIV